MADKVLREFTYDDITIVVRRAKLRDEMTRDYFNSVLDKEEYSEDDRKYRRGFSRIISRTESIDGLGWKLPTRSSTPEEIEAAFQLFIDIDNELADLWAGEVDAANKLHVPIEQQGETKGQDPN